MLGFLLDLTSAIAVADRVGRGSNSAVGADGTEEGAVVLRQCFRVRRLFRKDGCAVYCHGCELGFATESDPRRQRVGKAPLSVVGELVDWAGIRATSARSTLCAGAREAATSEGACSFAAAGQEMFLALVCGGCAGVMCGRTVLRPLMAIR